MLYYTILCYALRYYAILCHTILQTVLYCAGDYQCLHGSLGAVLEGQFPCLAFHVILAEVSRYLEMRHRSGLRPEVLTFALYRHRAHCDLDEAHLLGPSTQVFPCPTPPRPFASTVGTSRCSGPLNSPTSGRTPPCAASNAFGSAVHTWWEGDKVSRRLNPILGTKDVETCSRTCETSFNIIGRHLKR